MGNEKSEVLFGRAESIMEETRRPLIARRIKQNEIAIQNQNIKKNRSVSRRKHSRRHQALPSDKLER